MLHTQILRVVRNSIHALSSQLQHEDKFLHVSFLPNLKRNTLAHVSDTSGTMSFLERRTLGKCRVRSVHIDFGRFSDIGPFHLRFECLANNGTVSRCGLESRDSNAAGRGLSVGSRHHPQCCRGTAFEEGTDLFSLAEQRFHVENSQDSIDLLKI